MESKLSLFQQLSQGYFWNASGSLISKGVRFFIQLVLVKIITPEYFGAFAVANSVSAFMTSIGDLGFTSYFIQSSRIRFRDAYVIQRFLIIFNIILGLIISLLLFAINSVQGINNNVLVFSEIVIVTTSIGSINIVPRAILLKNINFRQINTIDIQSVILGSLSAVYFAHIGYPILSLISFALAKFLVQSIHFQLLNNPRIKNNNSKLSIYPLLRETKYDVINKTLITLTEKIDYLLLAFFTSISLVGIYELAFMLTDTIRQVITSVVSQLLLPVFSNIRNEKPRIRQTFKILSRLNFAIVLFPLGMLLMFANDLVLYLGEKWYSAATFIQLLSIAGIIHSVASGSDNILRSLGCFRENLQTYFVKTFAFAIPLLIVLIYLYGPIGACVAIILHKSIGRILYYRRLRDTIQFSLRDISFISSSNLTAFLSTYCIKISLDYMLPMTSLIRVSVVAFILCLTLYWVNRTIFFELFKRFLYERNK